MLSLPPRQHAASPDPDDPWGFGRPDDRPSSHGGTLVDAGDLDAVGRALTLPRRPKSTSPPAASAHPPRSMTRLLMSTFIAATVAASAGAYWSARPVAPPTLPAPPAGMLVLSSHPDGANVLVDGSPRGTTPLVLTLPAGDHAVQLSLPGAEPVQLAAPVPAGSEWRRHVTLTSLASAPPPATLRVETARAGAAVFVDGIGVGATPLSLSTLSAGEHVIEVRGAGGGVTRRVRLSAGTTTSLVLGDDRPGATMPGWLSVPSPIELQIVEDGRLLGVSRSERIMLPAGRHVIELVNEPLGLRQRATVVVEPDKTATVRIELPSAPLNINAQPWAAVSIDDRAYGETPLANLPLPIGEHVVTLRHPTLGEHTVFVTVRLDQPNRVSVDLRQ